MKCNIATAIALGHLNSARCQRIRRSQHISRPGIASKSNDWRMFEQQQHVANLASLAQIDQLSLDAKAFGIIDLAELDDRDHVTTEIIGPQRSAVSSGCPECVLR